VKSILKIKDDIALIQFFDKGRNSGIGLADYTGTPLYKYPFNFFFFWISYVLEIFLPVLIKFFLHIKPISVYFSLFMGPVM
jgi:hypothetical protein